MFDFNSTGITKELDDGVLHVQLLNHFNCSWEGSEDIVNAIVKAFKGKVCKKIDLALERVFDVKIGNDYLQFYHDDNRGFFLTSLNNDPSANPLVEEIAAYLEKDWKERGI